MIELGLPGLVVGLALLTNVIGGGLRRHFQIVDLQLRSVSAALLAVVIWNIVYAVKSQNLDFDPMDVYFWLFIGLLARIYALDRAAIPDAEEERPARATSFGSQHPARVPTRVPAA